ncbi:MAG: hypothetical protein HKN27_09940 [Silicimonas sp.]|nr:hypothetical protein [Silicimonas sp.]
MAAFDFFEAFSGGPALAIAGTAVVLLSGGLVLRRQRRADAGKAKRMAAAMEPSKRQSSLPVEVEDPDKAERRAVAQFVAGMMVADEWTAIADKLASWEAELTTTPVGQRFHDIGATVALSGLQNLIDEAPRETLEDLIEAETELAHFMDTYTGARDNHILSLLAARAHLIIGDACRANHWPEDQHKDAWRKMAHHFVKAGEILADFDALTHMSPLLAEAHYLQALGSPAGAHKLPELFETWIDLDPANPAIYEAHADYLSDPDNVSDDDIRRLAEEASARTEDSLGFGGYALFFLPLLDARDGARDLLDAELFASALMDLASISANQAEANWAAGRLAAEMQASGDDRAKVLRDTLFMLIESHISVIYPRLWPVDREEVEALVAEADVLPGLLKEAGLDKVSTKFAAAA